MRSISGWDWTLMPLLTAQALFACVSTDIPSTPPPSLCVERAPANTRPIVIVKADLGQLGIIECSGVLISPKIALTHLACLVLPPELHGEVPRYPEEPHFGAVSVFPNERDYRRICGGDPAWHPAEDGSFAGRLEEPVALGSLEVSAIDGGDAANPRGVREVLTSGAFSRCADSLAALVLDSELDLGSPSVRLTDTTFVGEPVIVVGIESEHASQVENLTSERGDDTTPPRALVVGRQACLTDVGGGVFSANSNAVVGIIGLGGAEACDGSEGQTIAIQIAPFRRLLLAAANEAGELLHVEADPNATEFQASPDCALPP